MRGTREQVILLGGGGHSSTVLSVIEAINSYGPRWTPIGILDDAHSDMARFKGRGVKRLGPISELAGFDPAIRYIVATGWPVTRREIVDRLANLPHQAAHLVHPDSTRGTGVAIGVGSVIDAGVRLGPLVTIKDHVYVARQAGVGHDTVVGEFASLMPASSVSGDSRVGPGAMIGAGAIVLEGISIGENAVVGAGAVVTKDVPPGMTVVGVPARVMSQSHD